MAHGPASARAPRAGRSLSLRLMTLLALIVVALVAIQVLRVATAPPAGADVAASDAALTYARDTTVWSSGPTAQSVRVVPLRRLEPALRAAVPAAVASDVNVSDLVRQYGPNRRVALVVLSGVYNSLPP